MTPLASGGSWLLGRWWWWVLLSGFWKGVLLFLGLRFPCTCCGLGLAGAALLREEHGQQEGTASLPWDLGRVWHHPASALTEAALSPRPSLWCSLAGWGGAARTPGVAGGLLVELWVRDGSLLSSSVSLSAAALISLHCSHPCSAVWLHGEVGDRPCTPRGAAQTGWVPALPTEPAAHTDRR